MQSKIFCFNYSKLLLLSAFIALFSCNTVINSKPPVVIQTDSTSSLDETCEYISKWDSIRIDSSRVMDLFQDMGNYFTFTRKSEGDSLLHVYLAFKNNRLRAYLEPYSNGAYASDQYNYATFSSEKEALNIGEGITVDSINRHYISPKDAMGRVENWLDDDLRNNWVRSCFTDEQDTSLVRAFVVDYMDFEMGVEHCCYLALTEDEKSGVLDVDLIVVSNYNALITLTEGHILLEDMVHSVPPFGKKSLAYSNFTLFKNCTN